MGIAVGQGTDVAAYAEVLAPEIVPNEEMKNRRLYFTVPADGLSYRRIPLYQCGHRERPAC